MQKKYIVRLSDQERDTLREVVKKLKGTSQKVRRAQILLKADADGPAWTDLQIAEAFSCRIKTVENIRQRLVERGFDETLNGKKRAQPPTEKLLDGEQEAKVIATRLGPPPKGYANWTLRLLARKVGSSGQNASTFSASAASNRDHEARRAHSTMPFGTARFAAEYQHR